MAGEEELPPTHGGTYKNQQASSGRSLAPKQRRSPNLPLTVLITIYIVALIAGIVLYFVGFAVFANDRLDAAGAFAWASGLVGLGVLGAMLNLAIAAIRHIVEDNAV